MGIAERREREREALRERILEAARDLMSEEGLGAVSMRAIAERIEYSPATIYLYFRDKEELIREVVREGFERMRAYTAKELSKESETADAAEQYAAMGRAYVRFALDNTAYFRVMFELPGTPTCECPTAHEASEDPDQFKRVVAQLERARAEGLVQVADARTAAVIGWGLVHGLTSLFIGGHLHGEAPTQEAFMALIEEAMRSMYDGWGRVESSAAKSKKPSARRSSRGRKASVVR